MAFNPALSYQTTTDWFGNVYAYQGGLYYDKYGDVFSTAPGGPPGYAAVSDKLGSPANGDQGIFSLIPDTSLLREGTQCTVSSGNWYTSIGSQWVMKYWSHNFATGQASGAPLGRDDAGPCSALAYGEDETLHALSAASAAAGVIPTLAQTGFWNLLNGIFGANGGYYLPGTGKIISALGAAITQTIPVAQQYTYFTTSGASMATTLPAAAAAIDGVQVTIVAAQAVATATWISSGASFIGAPAAFTQYVPVRMIYNHATLSWYPN